MSDKDAIKYFAAFVTRRDGRAEGELLDAVDNDTAHAARLRWMTEVPRGEMGWQKLIDRCVRKQIKADLKQYDEQTCDGFRSLSNRQLWKLLEFADSRSDLERMSRKKLKRLAMERYGKHARPAKRRRCCNCKK
jgi:hypothetical protein